MRAKSGEPFISMPISWKEISQAVKSGDQRSLSFTPAAAIKRIKRIGDLFEPVLGIQQKLPSVFTEALASGPPQRLSSWPRNRGKVRDKSLPEYAAKRDHSGTPEPAVSGRSMNEIAEANDAQWQSNRPVGPDRKRKP